MDQRPPAQAEETESAAPFHIDASETFTQEEADQAKEYWSGVAIDFYKKPRKWSDFIARRVLEHAPKSVFEFGCNAGKNLARIATLAPDTELHGIDVNEAAIEFAKSQGLNATVGDEQSLAALPDNSVDVSYTVSVLDHLPHPEAALMELARISRTAVLLLEPWLGQEGKVTRNTDRRTGDLIDTTPFSYSWDYAQLIERQFPDWHLSVEDYPMDSNLGAYYKLYSLTREAQTMYKSAELPTESKHSNRTKISKSQFSDYKTHIPGNIFEGINAFLNRKVSMRTRRWSKSIEAKRSAMKASDRQLSGIAPKGGYRPGEDVEFVQTPARALKEVVRAAKRPIWCRMLMTLTQSFKPKAALELGTCVGISGSYIAAGMAGSGPLYTHEGSTDFSMVAEETMKSLKLADNVHFVRGLFDQTLDGTIQKQAKWDFVFIDGHHDGDATLRYFEKIKPHLAENAIVLFDDIRWSEDMLRAWDEIVARDDIPLCMDFEEVGLCAFYPSDDRLLVQVDVSEVRN